MDFMEIFGRMWKRPQSKELGSSDEGPTDAGRNQDAPKDAQVISEPSTGTTTSELATLLRSEFAKMKPVKLPPLSLVTPGPVSSQRTEAQSRIKSGREEHPERVAALEAQARPIAPEWDVQVVHSVRGVSFRVDDVEPATEALICESVDDRLGYEDRLLIPTGEYSVIAPLLSRLRLTERPKIMRIADTGIHPLLDAVHYAFNDHRPFVLSPDAVWLVIAQGFGNHVKENAEVLRASFVRHQGQKKLNVRAPSFTRAGFAEAVRSLSTQIRKETNPVVHDALLCNFSTTTPEILIASEIVLMDTFSKYFEYGVTVCGIPRITLEGSREDWETMRARIEVLATYELEWWVVRLRPILDEFVLTAEGRPSPQFWRAIYKPREAYGGDVVTGWIADLFPYLERETQKFRNPLLSKKRNNWVLPVEEGLKWSPVGAGLSTIPSGLCKVALDVNGVDAELVAGFVGVQQDTDDLALAPVIDWFVVKPEMKNTAQDLCQTSV